MRAPQSTCRATQHISCSSAILWYTALRARAPCRAMQKTIPTPETPEPTAAKPTLSRACTRAYTGPVPKAEHPAVLVARALENQHIVAPLYVE